MGLHMVFLSWPGMGLALLPAILIETLFLARRLTLRVAQVMPAVSVSNMLSTGIGIPITWLVLTLVQFTTGGGYAYGLDSLSAKFLAVTWQAPWLLPYEPELYWMIPGSMLTLLVPYFFMTWAVEYRVMKRRLLIDRALLVRAVGLANLLTYSMLMLLVGVWFIAAFFFQWGA